MDETQKQFLILWEPKYAILCMVDKIFDYLDIEDLEIMT